MASEVSIGVDVPFPAVRYDPAVAGKYEERPSIVPALTQAYQLGTNLVENAWVNNYKYQLAQLNLKTAQSKLNYQDDYNQILEQRYDQSNQLFPLQIEQQKQANQSNQLALTDAQRQSDENNKALGQVDSARNEINALDPDALDFDDKITAIKTKYPDAYARGLLNAPLTDKYNTRSQSSVAQVENSQMAALEHAQQVDHLLPSTVNVRKGVMQGQADQLIRQANQTVLTNRVQTILQNSRPGTDSYNWATEMLGALRDDPARANQLFDAHGILNDGVGQSLNRWERALGVQAPATAGIVGDVQEEYGQDGKLKSRKVTYKNQSLAQIQGGGSPNQKGPLPDKPQDMLKDPVYQQILRQIPPELAGPNATDAQRKEWVYQAYLTAKGGQQNQQNPPATVQGQTPGFVQPGATPAPTPAPKGRSRKAQAQPGEAQPQPEPTAAFRYAIPRVRQPKSPPPPRIIPPPGERRREGPPAFQEGGYVEGEEGGQVEQGEYVVNPQATSVIGTEVLDTLNQAGSQAQAPPSISVEQGDPFTMAFRRARQATEVPEELLTPQAEQENLPPIPGLTMPSATVQQPGAAVPGRTPVARAGELGTQEIGGNPSLRALAYGPHSEGATAADMRQTKGAFVDRLQNGDIAVSPNLLSRYPALSRVNVVDRNGNVVMRSARVADTSWISAGNPTHDTFEIYNGPSLGSGYHLVSASDSGT